MKKSCWNGVKRQAKNSYAKVSLKKYTKKLNCFSNGEEKLQTFDELNFSSCVIFYRLREAEEESDDEGDIVLEFDERARISTLIVKVHKSVNILIKSQENFVFIG